MPYELILSRWSRICQDSMLRKVFQVEGTACAKALMCENSYPVAGNLQNSYPVAWDLTHGDTEQWR